MSSTNYVVGAQNVASWHEADIPEVSALVPNSVVHANAYVPSIRTMASCKVRDCPQDERK